MCLCELRALILWCWWLVKDVQVGVIRTTVIGIADWWKILEFLWQNAPLHCPLLRTWKLRRRGGRPRPRGAGSWGWDTWNSARRLGSSMSSLGTHDLSSGPHPSQSTRCYNLPHNVRNSGSPLPSRPFHPPAWSGDEVRLRDQALWKQDKLVSGRAWAERHGLLGEFYTVKGTGVHTWPDWLDGWWGRDQWIWDSAFCREVSVGCPWWRAIPSVLGGRWEWWLSGHPHVVCDLVLHVGDVDVLSPRPSHSPGTNEWLMVSPKIPQTRGTEVAGSRIRTGRRWDP